MSLTQKSVPGQLKSLPAAPFLVPAVMEALFSSVLKDLVAVVPGEADWYCANYARTNSGMILTSDSDLLAHELGSLGSVVFFRDMNFCDSTSDEPSLKVMEFTPSTIAARLGLKDITSLAFVIKQNNKRNFADSLLVSKQVSGQAEEYRLFLRENHFECGNISELINVKTPGKSPLHEALVKLDPRVSEYLHRALAESRKMFASHDREPISTGVVEIEMYLPFLNDDPTRASAWRCATGIRRIGYSLVGSGRAKALTTLECDRRGSKMTFNTVETLDNSTCSSSSQALEQVLTFWADRPEELSDMQRWRMCAISLVCTFLIEENQPLPLLDDIRKVVSGRFFGTSWAFLHFSAQVQASLYSIRMLHQMSNVVRLSSADILERTAFNVLSGNLVHRLSQIPPLRNLFPPQPTEMCESTWNTVAERLTNQLGVSRDSFPKPQSKRQKRKKKPVQGPKSIKRAERTSYTNNPYGVLAES